jgi:hypothetical protein
MNQKARNAEGTPPDTRQPEGVHESEVEGTDVVAAPSHRFHHEARLAPAGGLDAVDGETGVARQAGRESVLEEQQGSSSAALVAELDRDRDGLVLGRTRGRHRPVEVEVVTPESNHSDGNSDHREESEAELFDRP